MTDSAPNRRHAIITGGSSGIGKATACLLAGRGCDITIIARTPATLAAAKAEIESARSYPDQKVLTLAADVAERTQIEQAIHTAIEQNGPPAYLIASAGMAKPGYFQATPAEDFERTMAVNYFGALYALRAALPAMSEVGQGQIVLVSSGAGLIGIFGYTTYSPTKFALRGLAESLRGELKPHGIHVAIVYPPDTDTPQLVAENLTKPEETKRITGTAKTWSAEAVAGAIVRGLDRRAFVIAPGMEMRLLARLHSLLLPVLNWYFDRLAAGANPRK